MQRNPATQLPKGRGRKEVIIKLVWTPRKQYAFKLFEQNV